VLASGTVRGRSGYAPGGWLFYATGGFAWTYDRLSLTQLNTGASFRSGRGCHQGG
jgi:high affinity Mn2+ porin